jgi:repressor LexA
MLRIRELRKSKKLTSKELASIVGVAESTMSLYENGKREPDFDTLRRIADALDTDLDFLLGCSSSPRSSRGKRIPVFGSVAAGIPIEAITDVEDYEDIPASWAEMGEYVALRIHGDSMEPRFSFGDLLLVQKTQTVEEGDFGVFLLDGAGYVKQYAGNHLHSLNPAYEDIPLSDYEDVRCVGRVVGKLSKKK